MKRLLCLASLLALTTAQAETIFVPNAGLNSISRYDTNGNRSAFTSAFVNGPMGVVLDRNGNLFVSTNDNKIEKFAPTGADLGTFAATGLNFPMALAFDSAGNLYAANFSGSTVEKFTPAGAGTVFANVIRPTGLAFDQSGNLYVSNFGNTIEVFSPAGADLGPFASSGLNNPEGIVFDSLGNLYAANNGSDEVEKFSPTGADLGFVAQNISGPVGLAFDTNGDLLVVASRDATIRRITPSGTVSIFANTGFTPGFIAVQKPPTLVNLATRLRVLTGENVLDSGFIVRGPGIKQILIRGLGPSLGNAGVPGALVDPVLELHGSNGAVLQTNDNWRQPQQVAIQATGLAPTVDAEAAILVNLPAGTYTVIERGQNGGTGVGLMEIYDLAGGSGPDLVNMSTRGFVDTGSNVMIAGFIIAATSGGNGIVLVRGLGPSLGLAGVTNPLADPVLELHNSNGVVVATNDNWQSTQSVAIQASGLAPNDPAEAAILATLTPGVYTAIESGKNGGTGVGLVEVYNLQ
ncbi:MAG: NHL repeat-containing protein [Acidobacteriaceae bacterium]